MATAKDIIKQAESWIGYRESNGTHKLIIDIYNSHKPLARNYKVKYTDEWCATFVSAVAIKCGATDIIPTECGCQKQIELFKALGAWVENENRTPSPGDIIYYDWADNGKGDNTGWADHVGIVQKVVDNDIYVIEGNYSNSVKVRELKVNARYIRGYAIPKYKDVVNKDLATEEQSKEYFPKFTGSTNSIVDALKAVGANSSFTYRGKVAAANGIKLYVGTGTQNKSMLNLLKQGKLIKP